MEQRRTLKHISEDEIKSAVANSFTWIETCNKLCLPIMSGSQCHLKKKCINLGINFDHFSFYKRKNVQFLTRRDINEYLNNSFRIGSSQLKKKLFSEKLKEEKCEICGLVEWNGNKAPLELDHMDSNHLNNNLDNLQILCANCHAIETSKRRAGRKLPRKKYKKTYNSKKESKRKSEFKKQNSSSIKMIEWPSNEELTKLVWEMPTVQLSKLLGVSDSAITKRCRKLKIEKPPIGYWAKQYSDNAL